MIDFIRNSWKKYPNEFFYLAATVCLFMQLLHLRFDLLLHFDKDLGFFTYSARSVVDGLLLMLPYWLLPTRIRAYYAGIIVFLFSFWGLSQLWYYRTYYDLMPFSSFLMLDNVNTLLLDSIKASIKLTDILFVIPPVVLLVIYRTLLRVNIKKNRISKNRKLFYLASILILSILVHSANAYSYYRKEHNRIAAHIATRYVNTINNISYFDYNGFVPFCIYSFANTLLEKRSLNEKEKEEIENYLTKNVPHYTDNLYAAKEKQNLVFIIVESLNSWLIDFELDGIEVTPNLNRFTREDNSIVALHIQPQVKNGRSSDAHFMYNTGLLPINNGAVSVRFGDSDYPSLAKSLDGYETFSMVCDDAKVWNQKAAFKSYGFSNLYDKNILGDESGNVDDKILLEKAANKIKQAKFPFYAQLVTISMHYPYDELNVPPTAISQSKLYTRNIRNYLEKVAFCDNAIGKLIQELKESGIYDKSLIAIVSDHNEVDKNEIENRKEKLPEDKEIAMIVLNASQKMHYTEKMEQIDVYPTLLDLMGANHYSWKGLGRSIFRKDTISSAISEENRMFISDLMITKRYFNRE